MYLSHKHLIGSVIIETAIVGTYNDINQSVSCLVLKIFPTSNSRYVVINMQYYDAWRSPWAIGMSIKFSILHGYINWVLYWIELIALTTF